ncbi:hypothetical protein ACQCN2_17210 [Brevibacillus ginsengisoli]|uniref:hypothetical protein n=1 Tax=Brevibacillus ginsengisoli TaxID=363854 RepID=UPI003CF49192
MSQTNQQAQEQLLQATFQVFQAANETIFNTALTTAGFVSFLQEQAQSQAKDLITQSEEVRKANIDKLEAFVKETRELQINFQKNVQDLLKSSFSTFSATNPFMATSKEK